MYSAPVDEIEYDPLLVTFMSTLGESLQSVSQVAVLEGLLRQVAAFVYKSSVPPLDVKEVMAEGLRLSHSRMSLNPPPPRTQQSAAQQVVPATTGSTAIVGAQQPVLPGGPQAGAGAPAVGAQQAAPLIVPPGGQPVPGAVAQQPVPPGGQQGGRSGRGPGGRGGFGTQQQVPSGGQQGSGAAPGPGRLPPGASGGRGRGGGKWKQVPNQANPNAPVGAVPKGP